MKHKMAVRNLKYIITGVILLGLATGCDFLFGPKELPEGNIIIRFDRGENETRAALPDSVIAGLRYDVEFRGPGGEVLNRSAGPGTESISLVLALGTWAISAAAYTPEGLAAGAGAITVTVTPGNGTIVIPMKAAERPRPSSNADLSDLTVNPGTLSPAFNAGTENYTVDVASTVTDIAITAVKPDAYTSITINGGTPVASGSPKTISDLAAGANNIPVVVMAQDGAATKTYTVTVNRAYALGDMGPGGGLVFYDKGAYSGGWRYLEVSWEDLDPDTDNDGIGDGVNWCELAQMSAFGGATPPLTGTAIGDGYGNTVLIVSLAGDNDGNLYAARLCADYSGGGLDDWFLPSLDELGELDNARSADPVMFSDLGLITGPTFFDSYWSSSDDGDGGYAKYYRFSPSTPGTPGAYWGSNPAHLRAVRRF